MFVGTRAASAAGGPAAWTPASLTNLEAWWDPSVGGSAFTYQGGVRVESMSDLSGNGNTADNTGIGNSTPDHNATIGGLDALQYGGRRLAVPTLSGALKPHTIAAVVHVPASSGNRSLCGCSVAGGWQWRLDTTDTVSLLRRQTANVLTTANPITEDTDGLLVVTYGAAGAWTVRFNGASLGSGTSNATPTASTFVIADHGGRGEAWIGSMGEMVVTSDDLAGSADLTALEAYLTAKWL